ncbi:hypothetical protein D9M70_472670 [compost metagenome]
MPFSQVEGEDAVLDRLVAFKDVRFELQRFIIAEQTGIAVDGHEPDVLGTADDHRHVTAVLAGRAPQRRDVDDTRRLGQALADRRKLAVGNQLFQKRRFTPSSQEPHGECHGCKQCQYSSAGDHGRNSLASTDRRAST